MVSSVIAAWSDVTNALILGNDAGISGSNLKNLLSTVRGLNVGYFWMLINCLASAAYVGYAERILWAFQLCILGFIDAKEN